MAGIEYMRNKNGKKSIASFRKDRKSRFMVLLLVLAILFIIAFPFALDFLYGHGFFREPFHNSFPADVWFSFIGSYFPAAIIGVLTIYQAYIIQYKDKQYHKLLVRRQFVSTNHAQVFRYDESKEKIGAWTSEEIRKMTIQCGKEDLFIDWKKGYIIQCNICVLQGMDIDTAELKEIEWKINNKPYYQRDGTMMFCIMERMASNEYQATMFWKFQASDRTEEDIARCMACGIRHEPEYEISQITLLLQIKDDMDEEYSVRMQFVLQPQQMKSCQLSSTKEKYYTM